MKTYMTRLFTLALLAMVSMGAWADVEVQIANDGKFDGGTIKYVGQAKPDEKGFVTVTITVAPDKDYTIKKNNIIVVSTYPPSDPNARTRTPEIAENLTLYFKGSADADTDDSSAEREYTFNVPSGFGAWVKDAEFQKKDDGSKGPNRSLSTDLGYSGTYYIGSAGYNASTPANNYYLCPTEGWIYYKATDGWSADGTTYPNPFLTTYKCKTAAYHSGDPSNAVWIIEKHPTEDYYYIIHKSDSKYMTSNGQISGTTNANRMRVHIETVSGNPDDRHLFSITPYPANNPTYLVISPKSSAGWNGNDYKWYTVNGGNNDYLYGKGKDGGPTEHTETGGILGLYTQNDGNAKFYLEDYITRPNIAYDENSLVKITDQTGNATAIYYTTDGTTPTTSSTPYTAPFDFADDMTTIKAIAIVGGEASNVAEFTPVVHAGSSHVRLIQSQNNGWTIDESTTDFHFYMVPGDEASGILKVNTTSLFRPSMEWYFLNAGVESNVQYYYIVNNANGKYLCYDAANTIYMDNFGSGGTKFMFSITESPTAGTYNIKPHDHTQYVNKNTSNANANLINLANSTTGENVRWAFVLPGDLDKTAPFAASGATSTSYYKIASVGSSGYYIVPPSGTATNATTSNSSDAAVINTMKWYFEVAQAANDSDWLTYYHIRNAMTGDYLYFTKDANNAGACLAMSNSITEGREDRYMFTWAKTADTNVNYYIIPKNLKDVSQNQFSALQRDGNTLKTNLNRGAGNYAWTFEASLFKCETPVLSYDPLTGKISITCGTPGATIYVAHYDSAPSSSDIPELIAANAYSGEFAALPGYYKAVASRSTGGQDMSDATTSDEIEQFRCARPLISVSSTYVVTITCATPGDDVAIYYIEGDGDFNEDAANYGGTPYTTFTKNPNSVLKAIAVKGNVWSTCSPIATYDKVVRVITSGDEIVNMDGAYQIGASFTPSSSPIGSALDPFTGTLDGSLVEFDLGHPLFGYVNGATIKNVIISSASVSTNGHTGAIANVATGDSRIYNCGINGGFVSGSNYVGGIVGLLDGSARVINCYSYADITGGSYVGGIVGWNNVATTSTNLKTMVMNCMFYGDITGGSSKAPVYNGEIITNRSDENGVSNFNYFWAGASYVQEQKIDNERYNCALAAETRFLQRFEFFRHLLNSNRSLAAWWATGDAANKNEMMKWVLEPSQIGTSTPYPILRSPNKYPSVVNIDAAHAEDFSGDAATAKTQYNQGRNFGTLTINIENASSGAPTGANITTSSVTPNITDKDPVHFNFNYYKVQLPYYNDVGTGNYTGNKVVTGWEVTVSGGTHNFSDDSSDASASVNDAGDITLTTPYNFADRKSTGKDDYATSGRIFNQGAYFDVPEGVTSITIKPHWAKCVYVSDEYADVVYNQVMSEATNVTTVGGGKRYTDNKITVDGSVQTVYTSMSAAVTALNPSGTVYNNAIVLVGNVHSLSLSSTEKNKPFTIMSIDLDKDNEPDYSYILRFDGRVRLHPVRIDFLNVIGLGMAQKSTGGTGTYNFGIMQPYGWFECTNTGLFRVTQLEYDKVGRENSPVILHGGVIEQWVTIGETVAGATEANAVSYYHVGGNVWFKEFHIGAHQDKNKLSNKDDFYSPHPPISVTGGDFNEFYLTGLYNTPDVNFDDNAECYINGGHFGKVAGTGYQGLGASGGNSKGDIIWQIDNADIDEFYAGGINAAHKAEGNIYTIISSSRVDQFCGGPKFGDMNNGKKVVTNATNCTFRTFFGAGYGGNSYNRRYPDNQDQKVNINWNSWVSQQYTKKYDSNYGGVETRIDYQFLPNSGNTSNVCRLFVDYISFSLATTHDVTSKLTDCTITKSPLGGLDLFEGCIGNFYGGGSLGKVDGPVKSTLINCTVEGNAFGAGYSASTPKVGVMDNSFQKQPHYDENLGAYLEAKLPSTISYTWEHAEIVYSTETAINTGEKKLYTTENLEKSNLGSINGNVTLTLTTSGNNGKTKIGTDGNNTTGNVYGGGEESYVTGANNIVTVNLQGNTEVLGNVFGGGNKGEVQGTTKVNVMYTE